MYLRGLEGEGHVQHFGRRQFLITTDAPRSFDCRSLLIEVKRIELEEIFYAFVVGGRTRI